MSEATAQPTNFAKMQGDAYGPGHDYEHGSSHLTHAVLRDALLSRIRNLVDRQFARSGRCRVLEVGAGHGAFTDHVLAMGAEVTVTEMSMPSVDRLTSRYAHNPRAEVLYDSDGDAIFRANRSYDLVLCVSVLHHIPDYERFVKRAADVIGTDGAFASFHDPLWYPRRNAWDVRLDRAMYMAWRVRQGDLRRGIATRVRRVRGVYDEANPSDMVEYHIVRQGVDEDRLREILLPKFADVTIWRYFATQGAWLQRLGDRIGHPTHFGLIATDRLAAPA